MPYISITPEEMVALCPELFSIGQRKPLSTFAEQHAAALDAFNALRQPRPPASCSLLAAQTASQSGNASPA